MGMMFISFTVFAQRDVHIDPVLAFLGISSPEDADPYDVERLSELLANPLKINVASESHVISSSLFSRYQAASLKDYISRHGDVLSLTELAAVDGFGEDFVSRLSPFISLDSSLLPGARHSDARRISNEFVLRCATRSGNQMNYGGKYRLSIDDSIIMTTSVSSSYDSWPEPSAICGSLALKAGRSNVILGDFNARFGQGLVLWNGMSVGSLSSPASLSKRPTGLSQPWSFTGTSSYTGAAVEIQTGPIVSTLMLDASETLKSGNEECPLTASADVSWFRANGQLSLTSATLLRFADQSGGNVIEESALSLSQRWSLGGLTLFSELALDCLSLAPSFISGVSMRMAEKLTGAAMFRYYHQSYSVNSSSAPGSGTTTSNEHGLTLAGEYEAYDKLRGVFSFDAACFPEPKSEDEDWSHHVKVASDWKWTICPEFELKLKIAERIRSWGQMFKTEARLDVLHKNGLFTNTLRVHSVRCDSIGLLGYMEGGMSKDAMKYFLRFGMFCIDDWDDRIYVYERDAPGSFNVPAYYGRGFWAALTGSWRFAEWGRIHFRASYISYSFMPLERRKPGRAELRLQVQFYL